jgi:ATP-binding cassette subfamily B protein
MLKTLFSYFKGYGKYLILGPLCVLIDVAAELSIPLLMSRIVDVGIPGLDTGYIGRMGLIMVLLALLAICAGSANMVFSARAAQGAASALRADMFGRIQAFSFANIDHFSTASLVTRMTNDVNQLQTTATVSLRLMIRAPLMLFCALAIAISINASLAGILLLVAPLLFITVLAVMGPAQRRFTLMQSRLDGVNAAVQEDLIGIRVVKSFVREGHEQKKFGLVNDAYLEAGLAAMRLMMLVMPVMMLLMNGSVVAVIWFGGGMVGQGVMGAGLLISFISYIAQILNSLMMFAMVLMMAGRARASGRRVVEVLETEPTIKDNDVDETESTVTETTPATTDTTPTIVDNPVGARFIAPLIAPSTAPITAPAPAPARYDGSVEFSHVCFKYQAEQAEDVLSDISFTATPGQLVALVGGTGSGKSSLTQLIPRLYDISAGTLKVGGRKVQEWPLAELRQHVAMVLQTSRLFSGSIRQNLLWGNPQATEEQMRRAARIAQAEEFILSLPDGYDTELGQGGVNLSGGQKQRLCIARALLKQPTVLVLDDSASAVDSETEAKLHQAFYEELPGVTVLMIAQRISSVAKADKILVLQEGRLVGVGSHQQLMRDNEVYREIYYSQQGGAEGVGS